MSTPLNLGVPSLARMDFAISFGISTLSLGLDYRFGDSNQWGEMVRIMVSRFSFSTKGRSCLKYRSPPR